MISSVLFTALLASSVSAHGVILAAQGIAGSPESIGFQVDTAIARNCTGISPCQQDTTIIRDAEISANIVNQCGRTELTGNIDVGENTENQLAAGTVTQVKAGTIMNVTIHQVNADGAGPYVCDLDQTSNSGVISQNLTVTNNIPGVNGLSQAKTQDFTINVALPANLACTGASTGNICTVRCRNNAVAGPFGGCFAVQQVDVTPTKNSANQISTAQTLDGINKQIAQNIADLPVAVDANQKQGTGEAVKGLEVVNALLAQSITSKAAPVQTPTQENVGTNAVAAPVVDGAAGGSSVTVVSSTAAAAATATGRASRGGNGGGRNGNGGGNGGNKGGNGNGNNKRGLAMKWAKRIVGGGSE